MSFKNALVTIGFLGTGGWFLLSVLNDIQERKQNEDERRKNARGR